MDSLGERVFSPENAAGTVRRRCCCCTSTWLSGTGRRAVAGPLAEPLWETRSCPWLQGPQPARTGQRPGGQPGSAEAGGHSSGNGGRKQQGRPDTYTRTAEGLHAAKRKGKEGSGTGDSTSVTGGETPATQPEQHGGLGAQRRAGEAQTGFAQGFRQRHDHSSELQSLPELLPRPRGCRRVPSGQLCRVARLLCENRWLWDTMYFLNALVTSWLTCFCRSSMSESFASMVHVRLYS